MTKHPDNYGKPWTADTIAKKAKEQINEITGIMNPSLGKAYSQTMNLRVVRFMDRQRWRLEQAWISNEGDVEWHKVEEVTE